jgi:hypothetical protein
LNTAQLQDHQRDQLESKLLNIQVQLTIPLDLLRQNPYVDPLLQEELYQSIKKDPYAWIPTSYPNSRRAFTPTDEIDFEDKNFYGQFEEIAKKLDRIFFIESEVNSRFGDYIGIGNLIYDAFQWMSGKSHRYFIEKYLDNAYTGFGESLVENNSEETDGRKKVDKAARHVTQNISSNITFKLVKYFSLWADITKACIPVEEHETLAYFLSLPSMIELGSYDPRVLELMSLGINRSIALKLRKDLPKDVENLEEWLRKFNTARLSPLLRRYLERSGLTKQRDERSFPNR